MIASVLEAVSAARSGRFMSSQDFNPRMILLQIVAIQSVFYLCFVSSTAFMGVLWGVPFGLKKFFDFSQYCFDSNAQSFMVIMLWLNLIIVAFLLPRIIERTRKCLDFVVTMVVVHLVLSWIIVSFPTSLAWWTVWITGTAGCTLLGEYLCLREEQREIRLSAGSDEKEGIAATELGRLGGGE